MLKVKTVSETMDPGELKERVYFDELLIGASMSVCVSGALILAPTPTPTLNLALTLALTLALALTPTPTPNPTPNPSPNAARRAHRSACFGRPMAQGGPAVSNPNPNPNQIDYD